MACMPSIFIKILKKIGESWHQWSFSNIVANVLKMIEIGHSLGDAESGHPFFMRCILAKKYILKSYDQNPIC